MHFVESYGASIVRYGRSIKKARVDCSVSKIFWSEWHLFLRQVCIILREVSSFDARHRYFSIDRSELRLTVHTHRRNPVCCMEKYSYLGRKNPADGGSSRGNNQRTAQCTNTATHFHHLPDTTAPCIRCCTSPRQHLPFQENHFLERQSALHTVIE